MKKIFLRALFATAQRTANAVIRDSNCTPQHRVFSSTLLIRHRAFFSFSDFFSVYCAIFRVSPQVALQAGLRSFVAERLGNDQIWSAGEHSINQKQIQAETTEDVQIPLQARAKLSTHSCTNMRSSYRFLAAISQAHAVRQIASRGLQAANQFIMNSSLLTLFSYAVACRACFAGL